VENSTNQSNTGNKIPTIINRRVTNGHIKKPGETVVNISRNTENKINKFNHKVKIIGDSHLRGLSTIINQYLNTRFEVCSFIKPGASINRLVNSQEMEFKCLGKKDVIVINGGTNDIDNIRVKKIG
jgi:hypothetical protein